jgi:uncharacterized protein (DUF58 family)
MDTKNLIRPTPAEIFAKTRRIEIRTSRLVNELFGGRYHSTFKGRGMEFNDVREYLPGDDVRAIHWNVTARLGHPYIKRYTEERELTMLIADDVSRSLPFGTKTRFKSELAAELVSLLTFAAIKNNDKVGLLLFSDKVEAFIPPRKNRSHALRLIRDALSFEPTSPKTSIKTALEYINQIQKRRAVVFLISDFLDTGYEHILGITQRHHDTIAFVLEDEMEQQWPPIGGLLIEDAETGERTLLNGGSSERTTYSVLTRRQRQDRDRIFSKRGVDRVVFKTDQDYVKPLLQIYQERAKSFR